MPLPIYESADAVPEEQRDDFAEFEGKWRYKADIELASEKKKRAILLNEKKEADRLRADAENKLAESERTAEARARGISEEALEEIREKERVARKPLQDRIAELEQTNRQLTLTDRVQAMALAAGVMPDRIKQAMKILDDRTDLGNAGGIVVKNEDGSVSSETIDDFLGKTFKAESPWFYSGVQASGSGAVGSGSAGGVVPAGDQQRITEAKRVQVAGAF
jgi:hypothetical protein